MKRIISLLLCLFFLLPAKVAGDSRPFIAVFTTPDPSFIREWKNIPVNLLYKGQTWDDFKAFCIETKKAAGSQGVIIDIDVHGQDYLYLQYTGDDCIEKSFKASMGYICNQLRENLKGQVLEVDVEACYAGKVYRQTIRHNKPIHEAGDVIENYEEIPPYPMYGVATDNNYGNSIFLQRFTHNDIVIYDLRQFEIEKPLKNPYQEKLLCMFLRIVELTQENKNLNHSSH